MPAPCSPLYDNFQLAPSLPNTTFFVAGVDAPITLASAVPPPLVQGVTLGLSLTGPNQTAAVVGTLAVLSRINGTTSWGLTVPGAMLQRVGGAWWLLVFVGAGPLAPAVTRAALTESALRQQGHVRFDASNTHSTSA
jgi:hypothetical protein